MEKYIEFKINKNGKKFFVINFDYDPQIVEYVKKIPTRKFDGKYWIVSADHVTSKYINAFYKTLEFEIDKESLEFIESKLNPIEDIEIPSLKLQLRDFQKIGVNYLRKYEKTFLADHMGLGKSIQSIAAVESLGAYPCLIICPASLKINWKKEIEKWIDKDINVVDGLIKINYNEEQKIENKKKIKYKTIIGYEEPNYDGDFVIINYDIVQRNKKIKDTKKSKILNPNYIEIPDHMELLKKIKFQSVIIDESHFLSNHKSQRTIGVKKLTRNIKYKFALTGTPILNKPKELISQLDILDRLDNFGGFWKFAKKYCDAHEGPFGWDFSGHSNLKELHQKLHEICFIRRKKEDVLDELPDKERINIPIEIDRTEYDKASKNFKEWIQEKIPQESDYMKELKKIKTLSYSQKKLISQYKYQNELNKKLRSEALVKIEKLKQIVAKEKIKKSTEIIDNFLENDEKIVIFINHRNIHEKIYEKYKDISVSVIGGMSAEEKNKSVEEFQNNNKIKIFIGSLSAAGVGLTLTKSKTVIFLEFGWTSAIHDQAESRCHRIGQKDFVRCYYFYSEDTIDEYILEIIDEKRKISNNIIDGNEITDDISKSDYNKIIFKFI